MASDKKPDCRYGDFALFCFKTCGLDRGVFLSLSVRDTLDARREEFQFSLSRLSGIELRFTEHFQPLIGVRSGQGKSYLLKLLLTNIRESGKSIICLDPESEYEELCAALGGCYIDFMFGEYTIYGSDSDSRLIVVAAAQ